MVMIHRNFPAFEAAKLAASVIHWPCKAVLALRNSQPNEMPEASEASYDIWCKRQKKSPYQHIILVSSCPHDQSTTCQIPSSWWQKLINMTPLVLGRSMCSQGTSLPIAPEAALRAQVAIPSGSLGPVLIAAFTAAGKAMDRKACPEPCALGTMASSLTF